MWLIHIQFTSQVANATLPISSAHKSLRLWLRVLSLIMYIQFTQMCVRDIQFTAQVAKGTMPISSAHKASRLLLPWLLWLLCIYSLHTDVWYIFNLCPKLQKRHCWFRQPTTHYDYYYDYFDVCKRDMTIYISGCHKEALPTIWGIIIVMVKIMGYALMKLALSL